MKASLRHVLTVPTNHSKDLFGRIEDSNPSAMDGSESGTDQNHSSTNTSQHHHQHHGGTTASSGMKLSRSKIKVMEVHPCSPTLVAFVDNDLSSAKFDATNSHTNISYYLQVERQRIVIQDYYRDTTVRIITLREIAKECLISSILDNQSSQQQQQQQQQKGTEEIKIPPHAISQTTKMMGNILSIRFLDRHTVHWNMRAGTVPSPVDNFDLNALIIQFQSRIVVYSLGPVPYQLTDEKSPKKSNKKFKQRSTSILADITPAKLNKANPTSTAIPSLLSFVLVIGCSDGAMRFYDMATLKVIKSVRGPNGRNDPVVKIVNVNIYNYSNPHPSSENDVDSLDKSLPNYQSLSNNNQNNSTLTEMQHMMSKRKTVIRSRVVTVCSAGSAFLWELVVTLDENNIMEKFRIKPPEVRMDGWGKNVSEPLLSNSSSTGILTTYNSKTGSVEKSSVVYDPDRDFLIWSTSSGYGGSSKPHVVVWDLSSTTIPGSSNKSLSSDASSTNVLSPLHSPFLVIQINPSGSSGIVTGDNDIYTDLTLVAGVLHPSFSDTTLVSFVGGKNGDLSIVAASCSSGNDSDSFMLAKERSSNSITTPVNGNEIQFKKAATYFQCSLNHLKNLISNKRVLGDLNTIPASKLRLFAIASSRFHPNLVLMRTNAGIAVINIEESNPLISATRHVPLSQGATSGHGFPNSSNGIVLVENSSVFTAVLDLPSSNFGQTLVGPVPFKDPVLVYRSPNLINGTLESQTRRLPPRLLFSPSGKFLCLFWHAEETYEILHVGSIINTSRRQKLNGAEYSPAVDTGRNVLSFAWVGDEDVFALLHPPAQSKDTNLSSEGFSMSSNGGKDKKGLKKEFQKIKKTVNKLATTNQNTVSGTGNAANEDEDESRIDPSLFHPSVELKVLIATTADAAELSGSVAAATALSLGDLNLRGGVRYPPTVLFGGPVFCVGSLMQDKMDDAQSDGMAFFYSRKSGVDGDDNVRKSKASSYVSIGPSLPYPDLVVWDDIGKLCAVVVGRRVAIYLSNPPNFTFLGSTYLGTCNEPDAIVESAKFLHGTLYCSTRSSIQCVFLGDLDNYDIVCEIDSYTLASADGPSFASRPFPVNGMFISDRTEFQPVPYPMALNQPSILTYNNGSLLVSTVSGIQAVSLSHPLIRIGNLIGAGHYNRAQRWFDAIDESHHEVLASFLDRRGAPELAVTLPGLSLETRLDICLRYGYTEHLESLIDFYGVGTIRKIDMGRGFSNRQGCHSFVTCIGAYLLSQGKAEKVRCLASECMKFGEEGRKDSFVLATLLFPVDASDAKRLIKRAVGGSKNSVRNEPSSQLFDSWPVGTFVKDFLLK